VEAFKRHGEDFIVASTLEDLVEGMNQKGGGLIDLEKVRAQIVARDSQIDNPFTKDAQLMAVHAARNYRGDRLMRTAKPHRFLDPENGPLIAVKLHIITRKTLGGFETDLNGQVLNGHGSGSRGCSPPVRSAVSAAAAITATTRLRAASLAAASSPAARRGEARRSPESSSSAHPSGALLRSVQGWPDRACSSPAAGSGRAI
jgi:hypothetical protein